MRKWLLIFGLFASLEALPRVPVQQVVQYNNQFAFDLYKTLAKGQNNSFIIASYAVSSAFAITYLGSAEDSQKELSTIFRYPLAPTYLGESFKRINQGLSSDKNLKLASSVWMDRSFDVSDGFRGLVNQYYEGQFFEADFSLRTDSARNEANTWVAQRTNKKIPTLLSVSDVSAATKLLVIATSYLQAPWMKPFNVRDTSSQPFFLNKENSRTVTMMKRVDDFPFYEDEEVKVLELPYSTENSEEARLSFFIVAPKEVDGLKKLEENLGMEIFGNWISQMSTQLVDAKVPRFRITQTYSLKEILEKMGLKKVFASGADFSRMASSSSLWITKAVQKVYFSIDERGTDATTYKPPLPASQQGPKDFSADRPFIYFVYDNNLNQIVFIGRCIQP